ncbi:hypothetical protein ES689_13255 [Frigoribacterium sp. ACAM 257]|uniref:hypothetical protein n=1 Tax=Frigoribacterium sp. ACAM 257 TaxID=2508998 RepID=UPI0011B97A3E|nr:hypothetical protein [Frigoribacterium sp. ACAM 257]TWX35545.1 hypothetical protein ES689_13255 [Frigoribacterium sp. ACAM 257]
MTDDLTIDDGAGAGAGARAGADVAAATVPQGRLEDLALELGALAAETDGVARVHARPGAVEIARQALGGLRAAVGSVAGATGAAVTGAAVTGAAAVGSADGAAGRSRLPVTLAVTDDETRVVLDLAVDETASGPAVARAVAARLLAYLDAQQLPAPTIDVRVVGTSS